MELVDLRNNHLEGPGHSVVIVKNSASEEFELDELEPIGVCRPMTDEEVVIAEAVQEFDKDTSLPPAAARNPLSRRSLPLKA